MRNYLIDYENVRETGLEKIHAVVKDEDTVYLIYTANAGKIELDALANIRGSLKIIKVQRGKESLDMHLVSLLGFLLHRDGMDGEYYIVSNDTDYDSVIDFWRNTVGYQVSRVKATRGEPMETEEEHKETPVPVQESVSVQESAKSSVKPVSPNTVLNAKLMAKLGQSGLDSNKKGEVCSLVIKLSHEKNPKQMVYRSLIKKFGQKIGLDIYNLIKSEI